MFKKRYPKDMTKNIWKKQKGKKTFAREIDRNVNQNNVARRSGWETISSG